MLFVFKADRERFCVNDEEVLTLADYAIKVEDHYSALAGHAMPMDMEWAKNGIDGLPYVGQARPETVASRRQGWRLEEYRLQNHSEVLTTGRAVGSRIATGRARVIPDVIDSMSLNPDTVLKKNDAACTGG
jgi:pyruvate,water dikinase